MLYPRLDLAGENAVHQVGAKMSHDRCNVLNAMDRYKRIVSIIGDMAIVLGMTGMAALFPGCSGVE